MSYAARFGDIIDVPPGPEGDTALGLIPPTDVPELGDWVIAAQYLEPQGFAFRYRVPQLPMSLYPSAADNRAPGELELTFGRDAARFVQRVAVPVVGLMLRVPSRPSSIRVRRRKDTTGAGFQSGTPTPFRLSVGLLPYSPSDVRYPLTLRGPSIVPSPPEGAQVFAPNPVSLPRFARTMTGVRGQVRSVQFPDIPAAGGTATLNIGTMLSGRILRLSEDGNISGGVNVTALDPAGIPLGSWIWNAAQWYDLPPRTTQLRAENVNPGFGIAAFPVLFEPGETAAWVDAERLNRWPVDGEAVPELADAVETYSDPVVDRGIEAVA